MPNSPMDKYEQRRNRLLALVTTLGYGGRATVAKAIGKSPDYISRMLYPPGKPGYKRIGEDTADLICKTQTERSKMHATQPNDPPQPVERRDQAPKDMPDPLR